MPKNTMLELLKDEPGGEKLFYKLEEIREKGKQILSKINQVFPDYTSHTIEHKDTVVKNLNYILSEKVQKKINIYEKYFLISSIYLHDIGMAKLDGLENDLKNPSNIKEHANFIRDNHHLRSEEFINKKYQSLGIMDVHQARIIGLLCRGHRKEDLNNSKIFNPKEAYLDSVINIPFLAQILKIADEFDLTFSRTPMIIYENISPKDSISKDHWKNHLFTSGLTHHPENPKIIICSVHSKSPNIHRFLLDVENKINKELKNLQEHLHHFRDLRNEFPHEFEMNIKSENYKPFSFKFSLQNEEIFNLLMGEKLYSEKTEGLRELIKNSYDSCRFRLDELKKEGMSYEPEIVVEHNDSTTISIEDNGNGMNEYIIKNYFTKIGRSFYVSDDFTTQDHNFAPVGELGIGILSSFMLAEKIFVDTKKENEEPLHIEIDNISNYFFVREGKREKIGTKVTLILKKELDEINIEDIVQHYAKHLSIPIRVETSKNSILIQDKGLVANFDFFSKFQNKKLDFKTISITEDDVEGIISLVGEKYDDEWVPPESSLWSSINYSENDRYKETFRFFTSHEGIFIDNSKILPYWVNSRNLYSDLIFRNHIVDLNAARNKIIHNQKFKNFQIRISKILLTEFTLILEKLQQIDQTNPDLNFNLRGTFFARFIDYGSISKKFEENNLDDDLLEFYKKWQPLTCYHEKSIKYLTINEINELEKDTIVINTYYYERQNMLKDLTQIDALKGDKLYVLSRDSDKIDNDNIHNKIVKKYHSFFDIEFSTNLKECIPVTWETGQGKNFSTDALLIFPHSLRTILNVENNFVKLLDNNTNILDDERKMVLRSFFRNFKQRGKKSMDLLLKEQCLILKWYVDENIIKENEIENYLIKNSDIVRTSSR